MVANGEYMAVLGGEPRPVDVAEIERELTQLWKAAAADTLEGRPVVRACVLNLVAYAHNEDAADHINEVIAGVSGRHPNRSIVIVGRPRAKSGRLSASISAHCHVPPEGGKQVCSEEIILNASGPVLDELHGTVLPLLVSDLPVVLWWHDQRPPSGHLFEELVESSDHLIVDSGDFRRVEATGGLPDLDRLARQSPVALSDLNWERLTGWRELVAQFFDADPGRKYLKRLDSVSVEVAPDRRGGPLAEGLLVVGWLASRLGWNLEDGGSRRRRGALTYRFRGPDRRVKVDLRRHSNGEGEGLRSIVLRAGKEALFSVARHAQDESCAAVSAEMEEGTIHPRIVQMEPLSEAALVCNELDSPARDVIFEEALGQAVRLIDGA